MDIFTKLKEDHDKMKQIMEKIGKTSTGATSTRKKLFLQLKNELFAHAKVEEAVFYSSIQSRQNLKEDVLEAYNEHRMIGMLLDELDTIPKGNDQWLAKFHFLKELVEHHVEDEEKEVFPKAEQILSDKKAEELGELMVQREQAVIEALHPLN